MLIGPHTCLELSGILGGDAHVRTPTGKHGDEAGRMVFGESVLLQRWDGV